MFLSLKLRGSPWTENGYSDNEWKILGGLKLSQFYELSGGFGRHFLDHSKLLT